MSEDNKSQNNISIDVGDEVNISHKKRYRSWNMPEYTRFGITEDNRDIVDILAQVSKTAVKVFLELKRIRDKKTNISTLSKPGTATEQNARNKALKELMEAGLIKRVKANSLTHPQGYKLKLPPRSFLINPLLLIPRSNEDFEVVYEYWFQLVD